MTTFSPAVLALAADLAQRFQDVTVITDEYGDLQHAVLTEGAEDNHRDGHSHTLHRAADGTLLHLAAGSQHFSIYLAQGTTVRDSAAAIESHLGLEDIRVASGQAQFPTEKADQEAELCQLYTRFLDRHGLPHICCNELQMGHTLTSGQSAWARAYCDAWDKYVG